MKDKNKQSGFTPSLENGITPCVCSKKKKASKFSSMGKFLRKSSWRKNTMPFSSAGFTLIEMLVAVAVFVVILTASMTAFLNVIDIQRKAIALRAVNDNVNYVIEMMLREIRTGSDYVKLAVNEFQFVDTFGCTVRYKSENNQIKREESGAAPCRNYAYTAMTAPEVQVSLLEFDVRGDGVGDSLQPVVIISIKGTAGVKERAKSKLNLQTTVSQRLIDS